MCVFRPFELQLAHPAPQASLPTRHGFPRRTTIKDRFQSVCKQLVAFLSLRSFKDTVTAQKDLALLLDQYKVMHPLQPAEQHIDVGMPLNLWCARWRR